MITSVHTLIYSDDAAATRAFVKDVLQWPFASDEGSSDPGDWLIFGSGRGELGVHPTSDQHEGETWTTTRHHEIALMCDDITGTVAELSGRGAEFRGEPQDMSFGIGVQLAVPGADDILLYQPHHRPAYHL